MARVLVVDDEAGIREFLSEALADDDHEVASAASGEAAWARLEREGFDLVLTDLSMPGMDGLELLRRVREAQPDVEVVVITAHGKVDSAVEAMRLGAFDYLQKPLGSLAELRLLVRRAAERRALRSFREVVHVGREEPELSHGAAVMRPVIDALRKVAATDATVLLVGESGTGKEVAARRYIAGSRREAGPFVAVNCAALSESLLESELFGHERGAFTGAATRRRGRIELAQGGDLLPRRGGGAGAGAAGEVIAGCCRSGASSGSAAGRRCGREVRWIAATNRDLPAQIAAGRFREDLFHRLAVFPVVLPPLRERHEDLEPLAERLLARACAALGRRPAAARRGGRARCCIGRAGPAMCASWPTRSSGRRSWRTAR
jgi:two-component system response regulator AtoC